MLCGLRRRLLSTVSRASGSSTSHRTHTCGELSLNNVGASVQLAGWLQNTRRLGGVLFLALRDQYGVTQIKMDTSSATTNHEEFLDTMKPETIITITGTVLARPNDAINTTLVGGTGEIEVELSSPNDVNILNTIDFSNVTLKPQQLLYNTNVEAAHPSAETNKMASEEIRLQHRHIDLRRNELQRNLKLRAEITLSARNHLSQTLDFTEVETPILFKSTPEGAREFLVPTRRASEFYALPQSPQQHKQLLMCGGIDRYYQVARCFRDESGRSDRQPEFTQLDMEMAFVKQEDVMAKVESTLAAMLQAVSVSKHRNDSVPLPSHEELRAGLSRMTFRQAMETYGSDKPDVRYGLGLSSMTKDMVGSDVGWPSGMARALHSDRSVRVLKVPYLGETLSKREIKVLHDEMLHVLHNSQASTSTSPPEERLIVAAVKEDGRWVSSSPASRFLSDDNKQAVLQQNGGDEEWGAGDLVVVLGDDDVGSEWTGCEVLGWMRSKCAELIVAKTAPPSAPASSSSPASSSIATTATPPRFNYNYLQECSMMWVVDFPLFEVDEYNNITATHHPFTAPQVDDEHIVRKYNNEDDGTFTEEERRRELLTVKGQHYDIVCNGVELGGGSIRIHDASLQTHVFRNVLKLSPVMEDSFKHLTDALGHGCPPHGGTCGWGPVCVVVWFLLGLTCVFCFFFLLLLLLLLLLLVLLWGLDFGHRYCHWVGSFCGNVVRCQFNT